MGFLEVRADTWQGACEEMVNKLKDLGFCAGQIYAVDVHNNGPDEEAIVSAHWHGEPLGCEANTCHLEFEMLNDQEPWDTHYQWVDDRVNELKGSQKRIVAVSHSVNADNHGVTVLFYEHHNPYKFL